MSRLYYARQKLRAFLAERTGSLTSADESNDRDALPPELLAAYADGGSRARRVPPRRGLARRPPRARDDVEAQRRLARLFDESAPAAPADERWAEAPRGSRAVWRPPTTTAMGRRRGRRPGPPRPSSSWHWR